LKNGLRFFKAGMKPSRLRGETPDIFILNNFFKKFKRFFFLRRRQEKEVDKTGVRGKRVDPPESLSSFSDFF
jgi:hypothetical protein